MSSPRPLTLSRSPISIPFTLSLEGPSQFPNSNGIISFADPHLLNPFLPYRYKNHGGRGYILQAKSFFLGRRFARSLFSRSYKLQISQLLSFDIHANWWGVGGCRVRQNHSLTQGSPGDIRRNRGTVCWERHSPEWRFAPRQSGDWRSRGR